MQKDTNKSGLGGKYFAYQKYDFLHKKEPINFTPV